jgi:regulator of sirC expression with transglutaminase-like and TPR domain
MGQGFGGRSLCLCETAPPEPPFEVAVTVKLDHEEGAAGIVFCADGGDLHYGFYPSNGRLRLSRFDGPDVFKWNVLAEVKNDHYRPGDWNTLKVRFEKGKIRCFVNDDPAIESTDDKLAAGKVGLAKFRATEAEFRNFQVAREVPRSRIPEDVIARIAHLPDDLAPQGLLRPELAEQFVSDGTAGVAALRERAGRLERQAAELRKLAQSVHYRRVAAELVRVLDGDDSQVDLFHAALLIALLDNDEIDVDGYRKELDRMARELARALPENAGDDAKLAALKKYLFEDHGFHGSRGDYYHRSNSYINEVLDDREGLPITLSVVYLELARKIGVKVVGVGLPGHFVVRHEPDGAAAQLIDVFEGAQPLTEGDAQRLVRNATGRDPRDTDFTATPKRAIIVRMLRNLMGVASDAEAALRYVDAILAIVPDSAEHRWLRVQLCVQTRRREEALRDIDWLLENRPEGINLNDVDALRRILDRP